MKDYLKITGITLHAFHGVYDTERQDGQTFKIDLTLYIRPRSVSQNDSLSETVDYSKVVEAVAAIVSGKPVNLIETLAENIANAVLETYETIDTLEVTVHKPNAPLGVRVEDVSVHIVRSRQ